MMLSNVPLLQLIILSIFIRISYAGPSETLIGIQGKDFVLLACDGSIGSGGAALTTTRVDKIRTIGNGIGIAGMGDPADVEYLMRTLRVKHRLDSTSATTTSLHTVYDCSTGVKTAKLPKAPKRAEWTVESIAEALRYEIYSKLRTAEPMQEAAFLIAGTLPKQGNDSLAEIENVRKQIRVASTNFQTSTNTVLQDENAIQVAETLSDQQDNEATQPALFWLDQYGSLQQVAYGAHGHASSLLWSVLDGGWHADMNVEQAQRLLNDCMTCLKERYLFNPSHALVVKCIDANGCRRLS